MSRKEQNDISGWESYIALLKRDQVPSGFDPLPKAVGVSKEILSDRLQSTLKKGGYSEKNLDYIKNIYEFADKAVADTPGEEKRASGDDTTTHPLWMAVLISESITCDKDVIAATILHDVHEDLGIDIEEIEKITNPETAELVELLSKVKTKSVIQSEETTESEIQKNRQKEIDEKNTQLKLLDAFESDIRAFIIKAADVIHNQMTSEYMPKDVRERKAKLALDFYEPLLRRLGFAYLANMIGDFAYRSVEFSSYDELKKHRDNIGSVTIPFFNDFIDFLMDRNNSDKSQLPTPNIVEINSPSIYEISQNIYQGKDLNEAILPYATIVLADETELFQWHRVLRKYPSRNDRDINFNELLDAGGPIEHTVELGEYEDEIPLKVRLYTQNAHIKPAHLFIDGFELDDNQRKIAVGQLASIIRYYRQELSSDGDVVVGMKEAVERGTVDVFDKDGTPRTVSKGSTAQDFAFHRGKNLGKDAIGVSIYTTDIGGQWNEKDAPAGLGTILNGGEKIVIQTEENTEGVLISPSKYELVTTNKAITNIREFIDQTLREIGLNDDDLEKLYKGEEVYEIYVQLRSKLEKLPEAGRKILDDFIKSIETRGSNLIGKLYETKRGKKLDSNIMRVFENTNLGTRFKNLDVMYFYIGLTPVPYREGKFLEKWQKMDNPEFESIVLNNSVVKELIRFRDTRITMHVSVTNQLGVVEKIGELAQQSGLSIQTIRSSIDNEPRRGESSTIEVVFENGDMREVSRAMATLRNVPEYHQPGFNITFADSYLLETRGHKD